MFILFRKHLFSFSLIIICLTNITTLAQPPPFFHHICENKANYTINSPYQRNLDTALSALPTTNSGFGYFNFTTGQLNDRVISFALCRGDLEPALCTNCVNDSIIKLRELCPNQTEAIGYYNKCFLKYSNETRNTNEVALPNLQNTSNVDRFNAALRELMDRLRGEAAAGGPLLKFATGNITGPNFSTIYGLMQCTPDLPEQACSDCLEAAVNRIPNTNLYGKDGGRILQSTCNFRYYTKWAGIGVLSIVHSLANSMLHLNEQYLLLFDPLWIYSTSVIHLILQPEVEVYIFILCFRCSLYNCVV
ncbi:putative Gnk2-like domain-containing protein [Helianthus annuus]|uniref:Gnk2-like domain-containing protein n=1 Tax=Helianthus annuus TaxID=4232 RepID=A0A9K3GZT0_HELAN|nr:putative Gnk2-like domain-containing protein [Helianthus annuus]